jgi:lysozyme
MSRRRRRSKKKSQIIIWTLVGLVTIMCVVFFYSDIKELFKFESRKSQTLESYRKNLTQYSVFGIDVSQYQSEINWEVLQKEENIDFVFIRATAGKSALDKRFLANWAGAKNQKIIRGAYHYYRPDENSTEQAMFFIKNVTLEQGDLPPVLDIEKYSRVQSLHHLKSGLLNWLRLVEDHYGITPILYTYNKFFATTLVNDDRFDKYPIWIAWYNIEENPNDVKKGWVFWQFTDKGRLKGIEGDVDINVFNGKLQDLDGLRVRK